MARGASVMMHRYLETSGANDRSRTLPTVSGNNGVRSGRHFADLAGSGLREGGFVAREGRNRFEACTRDEFQHGIRDHKQ